MKLHEEEFLKFVDIFVDIYEYGKKSTYNSDYKEDIIDRVDEVYFDRWRKYLNDKCESYESDIDQYDIWFDSLSCRNDISDKDMAVYELPLENIEVRRGNEEVFMKKLLALSRDLIENNKPYCNEQTQVGTAYQFINKAVYVSVYTYKDIKKITNKDLGEGVIKFGTFCDDEALRHAKSNWMKFYKAAIQAGNEFNEAQGKEPHVHIGSSIGSEENGNYLVGDPVFERTFAIDGGCDTLFYPNKKVRIPQSYIDKFFATVPDEVAFVGPKYTE